MEGLVPKRDPRLERAAVDLDGCGRRPRPRVGLQRAPGRRRSDWSQSQPLGRAGGRSARYWKVVSVGRDQAGRAAPASIDMLQTVIRLFHRGARAPRPAGVLDGVAGSRPRCRCARFTGQDQVLRRHARLEGGPRRGFCSVFRPALEQALRGRARAPPSLVPMPKAQGPRRRRACWCGLSPADHGSPGQGGARVREPITCHDPLFARCPARAARLPETPCSWSPGAESCAAHSRSSITRGERPDAAAWSAWEWSMGREPSFSGRRPHAQPLLAEDRETPAGRSPRAPGADRRRGWPEPPRSPAGPGARPQDLREEGGGVAQTATTDDLRPRAAPLRCRRPAGDAVSPTSR